jgi:hypothetical protein
MANLDSTTAIQPAIGHNPDRYTPAAGRPYRIPRPPPSPWKVSFFSVCATCDPLTCCMALFLPCVVHGKNEWRMARIVRGEDALDSNLAYGCNICCFAYAISALVTGCQLAPGKWFSAYLCPPLTVSKVNACRVEANTR